MKEDIKNHIELCINSAEFLLDEFYQILAMNEEYKNKCSEINVKNGKIYQLNAKKGGKNNDKNICLEQECIQKNDISNTCNNCPQVPPSLH